MPCDSTIECDDVIEMYRRMVLIRRFEEHVSELYSTGEIPGFVHISSGQEAVAVGACHPLDPTDAIVSNHRGHGHLIAKGADVDAMMAELFGRATGTCRGLGGSMHIAEVRCGVYGANGIVGAGLPISVGVATAFRLRQQDGVVVAFFGDGAVAQGSFHEAVNLAALWELPVVFLCENNGYAEFSAFDSQHLVPVIERARAYGIEAVRVEGSDVEQVAVALEHVMHDVRNGSGPVLVEAATYRFHGHYEGDPERYRSAEEVTERRSSDPITVTRSSLIERGVDESVVNGIQTDVEERISDAVRAARHAPYLSFSQARTAFTAPRPEFREREFAAEGQWRVMDAVHDALEHALEDDDRVWLAGIDVASGNVFGLTRGLSERFPGRVRDTPISEAAIVGAAVGGAMAGTRPVVEIMYLDFIGVCLDQLMNQAAKIRYMTGGAVDVPLVVRTQFGAGRSSAAQHSQSLEALLAHIPGLSVVMPSTPEDTYGLLRAAIEDPNPVIVIDNRQLYGRKGPRPPRGHTVPIGRGVVRRDGSHITIVSWSRMVHEAMAAAHELEKDGIETEVIDMRTVAPLDLPLVAESVQKTGHLVIAHEAVLAGGLGAEIAASISESCFWHLDGPIVRVGAEAIPAPYAPPLEKEWLPNAARIEAAVRRVMDT